MLLNVKPDTFEDLPAITALYRPGPMGMNAHNEFAEKKNNIEARIPANEVDFIGTKVEDILKPTLGLLVYQEQIMTISKECAGFTSREADDLRKAIGKKKMDLMKSLGGKFKSGMIANGYPEKAVNNLWEGIVGFGQYSFNKSHSVSYALLAYQSAYLKAHYPTEFMCAVARQRQGDDKKFKPILAEIRKRGINILPASVNSSAQELQPSIELKNTIVYGLNAIKGLSGNIATEIQLEREENGKYKNLSDFIKRLIPRGLTKGALITLAKVGAFDDMNISRKAIVDNADKLFSLGKKKAEKANKLTLFSGMNLDQSPTFIDLPKEKIVKISAYCDTADTGDDFLCNIIYADCKDSAYILDVIYTKEAMEITEPLVAEAYKKFNVNVADIESNNGGRAFARNIERITRDKGNYKTVVKWFHQSGNKIARILSNSAWVNNNIYMPIDWKNKWSEFAKDIISYQKEGKNKHDDGPDALTGIAEKMASDGYNWNL